MIHPSFEIAVEDDIIRKNPAKKALGDYGEPEKKRTALTLDHQLTYKNYGDGCNFHKNRATKYFAERIRFFFMAVFFCRIL